MLGRALGTHRKDVVVVTKCGSGYASRPPKGRDSRNEAIIASLEQSLQNLQTDYVDVLMPHWVDTTTPFEETMHALDSLVQQGKVRAVGLSNFTFEQLKECEKIRRIDVVQYQLNLFDRRMEKDFPLLSTTRHRCDSLGAPRLRPAYWNLYSEHQVLRHRLEGAYQAGI